MTQPDERSNGTQRQQFDQLRHAIAQALTNDPSFKELSRNISLLTWKAVPAAQLQQWSSSIRAAVQPMLQNAEVAAGLTASLSRSLQVMSMATSRAIEPAQIEGVRALLDSFAQQMNARHASSSLLDATGQLEKDEVIDVAVVTDGDPEAEAFADSLLEVIAREAPEVAQAIDEAADAASTPWGRTKSRRVLANVVFVVVLVVIVTGTAVPPPWNLIAAGVLGIPEAFERRKQVLEAGGDEEDKARE
ncbi:hypothetical protein [Georgenia sp. AZ-5]|uniref:hypothetical protein n=1 Tax=Georgenia sp. AZ-5 TaxID=3367526 RepID=UPI003754F32C